MNNTTSLEVNKYKVRPNNWTMQNIKSKDFSHKLLLTIRPFSNEGARGTHSGQMFSGSHIYNPL